MCTEASRRQVASLRPGLVALAMESKDDLKTLAFWRSVLAEFWASVLVVLVGCGAWIQAARPPPLAAGDDGGPTVTVEGSLDPLDIPVTRVSLAFGLIYAVTLHCMRDISGGHISSAVTMAMMVLRRVSVARALVYMVGQVMGAMLGAAILYGVTSQENRGLLGCTVPGNHVTGGQAFGVEFVTTFILVLIMFICYETRGKKESLAAPFIVGLVVAALSLFALPYTGASFNPARSFGPAVIMGVWNSHLVYWLGPILGGLCGALLYEAIFAPQPSLRRLCHWMTRFRKEETGPPPPSGQEVKLASVTMPSMESERVALRQTSVKTTSKSMQDIDIEADDSNDDSSI